MGSDRPRLMVDLNHDGFGAYQATVSRRPHVEPRAEGENEVGLGDQLSRQRRGEPTRNAERPRAVREETVGDGGGGKQRPTQVAEALERLASSCQHCAPPGQDERTPRAPQPAQQVGQGCRRGTDRLQRGAGDEVVGRLAVAGLDVERQHQRNGTPLHLRPAHCPDGVRDRGCRAMESLSERAHRHDHPSLVDAKVGADRGAGCVSRQQKQGCPALGRLGQAGHGVGQAWTLVCGADAEPPGYARVRVRHCDRGRLVTGSEEARPSRDESIGDLEVAAAKEPEGVPHTQLGQRLADRLGDSHGLTRASTRAGLPDPRTMGSGATMRTMPVAGSRSTLASWVSPNLPAPSMKAWQGKGGSKLCAATASVPTVSTPIPTIGDSDASQRAHSTARPGVCGPVSLELRKARLSSTRVPQPVR